MVFYREETNSKIRALLTSCAPTTLSIILFMNHYIKNISNNFTYQFTFILRWRILVLVRARLMLKSISFNLLVGGGVS